MWYCTPDDLQHNQFTTPSAANSLSDSQLLVMKIIPNRQVKEQSFNCITNFMIILNKAEGLFHVEEL